MKEEIEILTIAESEFEVLMSLAKHHSTVDPTVKQCKEKLAKELESATVLKDVDMPKDVVRMGSVVDVLTPFGEKNNLCIVMPGKADFKNGKLSIMSPIGTAVLGHKLGEEVKWNFPQGEKLITIKSVKNTEK